MNKGLKKIAFVIGVGILLVSIYWSQDGWNFNIAGDSGYGDEAIFIGWFLAISVSVLQFVFSSNFRELNMSLIVIGVIAYVYSIITNHDGIVHFQGTNPNDTWAWGLGFLMDATAEPLIAWSLGVSRDGDFLGNILKTIGAFFNGIFDGAKSSASQENRQNNSGGGNRENNHSRPIFGQNNQKKGENREKRVESMGFLKHLDDDTQPRIKPEKPSRYNL